MANNRTKQVLRSNTHDILYEGHHTSYKKALEQALMDNVGLDDLNAQGRNLRAANLDGLYLNGGNFRNCDLTDANLSEASLTGCLFDNATLFDACFCYSDLVKCYFTDTRFGLTDFSEASLTGCSFSGISWLMSDLSRTHSMHGNVFMHDESLIRMSTPPIVIRGLKNIMALFDDKILVGTDLYQRPSKISLDIPVSVEINP